MRAMYNYSRLLCMAIVTFCLVFTSSCGDDKKDDPVKAPTLTTAEASAITSGSATSGGNVTSDGGGEITARGVCWGTAASPTIDGSKTTDGKGTGNFTSNLTGLAANTKYYVRAYATNSAGTAYGNEVSFTTATPEPGTVAPVLTTAEVSAITATRATAGGNITNVGTPAYTERGVCYATTTAPTTAASKVSVAGTGTGAFTADLTGLTANTKYYVRAYAVSSSGTVYGTEVSFTTADDTPSVSELTTAKVSAITTTTATTGGNIPSTFTYTERGVCFGITTDPTIHDQKVVVAGTGTGAFTANLTSLIPNTKYYVRAYTLNGGDVFYGNEVSFTTQNENIDANSVLLLEGVYTEDGKLFKSYTYDAQGRLTKMIADVGEQNIETEIKYNSAGDVIEANGRSVTKVDNVITIKEGNTVTGIVTLNGQGLPIELKDFEEDGTLTLSYDTNGNLLEISGGFNKTINSYDNKKSPLYSCASPKWVLILFDGIEYGINNNPLSASYDGEGTEEYTYEYNAAGYPVKRSIVGVEYFEMFTYKKK